MSNYEFFCEVQDKNIKGCEKGFMATVQFLHDQILITCMDASQKLTSEVYFKTRPDVLTCPTFHQISYRSIRFVMRKGSMVTICGLRKDVRFKLSPINEIPIDAVLESIEGDCEGRQVFTPVCIDKQIKQFIGESSYRQVSDAVGSAEIKFWINNMYATLCGPEVDPDNHTFESWMIISQGQQEAMERIARLIRRQIMIC